MNKLKAAIDLVNEHVSDTIDHWVKTTEAHRVRVEECEKQIASLEHDKGVSVSANKRKSADLKRIKKIVERALLLAMSDTKDRNDIQWARSVYQQIQKGNFDG